MPGAPPHMPPMPHILSNTINFSQATLPHRSLPAPGLMVAWALQDYYRGVVSEVEANGMGFHRDGPPPFRRNEPREDRWMGDMDNYGGRDSGGYSRGGPPSVTRASAPAGDNSSGSTIIKLRGLPYSVSDEDICQWFNDDKSLGISPVIKDK